MPTDYTGNEANVTADRSDVTGQLPIDGDPRNASSVNTPLQRLFDFMQRARKKAGFLDLASTWTALQTFSAANFTGPVTVGGTLGVTGPTTLGPLTASSITSPYPLTYTTPVDVYFLTSAVGFTSQSLTSLAIENPGVNWRSETTMSGGIGVEIKVPGGAVIKALEFSLSNVDSAARGVSSLYASIRPASMVTGDNQVLVSNGTVSAPNTGALGTPQWIPATLASPTLVVPVGGHVYVRFSVDATTGAGQCRLYGVRVLASVPVARLSA